jgi:hypothetical protein
LVDIACVDSAEGHHNKGNATTMAEKLNPNAELVAGDTPPLPHLDFTTDLR